MHVLVATHDLYPDPESGGTGRYVYETARRFVERGHRVSVITRRRGGVARRETVAGIDVRRYDLAVAGESAPTVLRQLPAARQAVRDHVAAVSRPDRPDVVSFQGPVTSLLVHGAVSRLVDEASLAPVPRVTTFHSPWPTEYAIRTRNNPGNSSLRRWLNVATRRALERRVLARSDAAITLSDYMRGQLQEVYGAVVETTVVPGGVDPERFTPNAGVYEPMVGDGPAFLTVRRLSERMGLDVLLEAFVAVRREHPDARLYVAGNGPLRERLERLAARLGVADRTTFLGYVPDEDLPAAYATADVFVLPTTTLEGFGLATLEALASGTPVVATPVGGTVEVLAGLRARLPVDPLVDAPSEAALAEGMSAWAALDGAERERAGDACRRYARERYDWNRTVSALLAEYERYLA